MTDQNTSGVFSSLRCRKCQAPIELKSEQDIIDKFGTFTRISCNEPECGHIDWYKEVTFVQSSSDASSQQDGPGEIWIHDVMLGLSFRADMNHQAAWDGLEKQI
ncbi:MAG TPA: hypothetical protein VFB79_24140 [Candidatus Angelobacter sp.]|nr:hypothetical protein [Candidatus Angelobacter sp.]